MSSRAYAAAAAHEVQQAAGADAGLALPPTFGSVIDDTEVRLLHLAESVGVDAPELLQAAVAWYKIAFAHRGVGAAYLPASLRGIQQALHREFPAAGLAIIDRHLEAAARELARAPVETPSFLSRQAPHGELALRFLLSVLERNGDEALQLVRDALAQGVSLAEIHDHVLTQVQRESGRMWVMGEIPIADEHYGTGIVDRALWLLQDRIPRVPPGAPKVLTMGVGGNLHDFGLRLVAQRLQLAGFAVHHLGANMPTNDLDWAMQDRDYAVIAISATLTLHVHAAATLIQHLRQVQRDKERWTPILVGGEPFRLVPDLHRRIGADAAATDAEGAVAAVRRLLAAPG
jgi:methanogenic corrinoid protein MtbC1